MPAEPPPIRVVVCKAGPVHDEQHVESRIIEITRPFDEVVGPIRYDDEDGPRRAGEQMALDAGLIHGALLQLPQGTLDRLIILMLEREMSLLRVNLRGKHDEDARLRHAIRDALEQLADNTDAAAILRRALDTEGG